MTADREQLARHKRMTFLEYASDAERRAATADNPDIADQWRVIASTWRTLAEALNPPALR